MGLRLGDRLQRLLAPLLFQLTPFSLALSSFSYGRGPIPGLGNLGSIWPRRIVKLRICICHDRCALQALGLCLTIGLSPEANSFWFTAAVPIQETYARYDRGTPSRESMTLKRCPRKPPHACSPNRLKPVSVFEPLVCLQEF